MDEFQFCRFWGGLDDVRVLGQQEYHLGVPQVLEAWLKEEGEVWLVVNLRTVRQAGDQNMSSLPENGK